MSVVLIIVAALLGAAAAGSGIQKLRRDPKVMESMSGVGVGAKQVPVLALLELLGALGLLVGIWVAWIGLAAAIGLVLYFLGAIVAHVRVKTPAKDYAPVLIILLLAVVTVALEAVR